MEQTQMASEALLRLEEPFASKEVKWIVKATSRDGRKGRVVAFCAPHPKPAAKPLDSHYRSDRGA